MGCLCLSVEESERWRAPSVRRVRVVDENDAEVVTGETGETIVRGHCIAKVYLDRHEETAVALRGGFNVCLNEIEEVPMTRQAVSLAAVVSIPHFRYGEEIKAFMVRAPGRTVDTNASIDRLRRRLATDEYLVPVEIRDSLPMNVTGKLLKKDLRA